MNSKQLFFNYVYALLQMVYIDSCKALLISRVVVVISDS
jgi:hypothetical protein